MTIRIAIVGYGKIARDQHSPNISNSAEFDLVAVVSRDRRPDGLPTFESIDALLASDVMFDAVALCQPPQVRFAAALKAINAGKHVFLEKPPGATLSEIELLAASAHRNGVSLFASWHSRFAAGVQAAKSWLVDREIRSVEIMWKEDVRQWHPGQQWIWEPGGLGVFDPGVNALSIATEILPAPFFLIAGTLSFPANRKAPIAADLTFSMASQGAVHAVFDWRQTGPQTWDIRVNTDRGELLLSHGGSTLSIVGQMQPTEVESEYTNLYNRFAELIRDGHSEVDIAPLRHVADAFLRGDRAVVAAFEDAAPGESAGSTK
jgi:D-galactose 1-dehydrogenase